MTDTQRDDLGDLPAVVQAQCRSWGLNPSLSNAKSPALGNSLVVQWLGLHASIAGGPGSIPGQGTRVLQAAQRSLNK